MKNLEIRKAVEESGLKYWQIADELGIVGATFSVWLRHELPADKKEKVIKAIDKLVVEKGI